MQVGDESSTCDTDIADIPLKDDLKIKNANLVLPNKLKVIKRKGEGRQTYSDEVVGRCWVQEEVVGR